LIVRFGLSEFGSGRFARRWRRSDREFLEDSFAARHGVGELVWRSSYTSDDIGEESFSLFLLTRSKECEHCGDRYHTSQKLTALGLPKTTRFPLTNPNQLLTSGGISFIDPSTTARRSIGSEGSRLSRRPLIVDLTVSPTLVHHVRREGMKRIDGL
jgi:hypothetical protein